MFEGLAAQRLLALFALGWLVLDFPLLGLWDRDAALLGIPLLPMAVFLGWALLIAMLAWIVERDDPTASDAYLPATIAGPAPRAPSGGPAVGVDRRVDDP